MESAFPQAAFASEVWQLDFSRQRDWFAVGNSRLGDFFFVTNTNDVLVLGLKI